MKPFLHVFFLLMSLTLEESWTTMGLPDTAPSTAICFTDVSASTGIDFIHHGGSLEKKIVVEEVSGGVAIIDYDGDGWLDIHFVNSPAVRSGSSQPMHNRLYRNNHDGTFTDMTVQTGVGFQGW